MASNAAKISAIIVAIVLSGLVGAVSEYYEFSSRIPPTSTQTITEVSQNTVIEIVTSAFTARSPSKITLTGTVDSEYYYPSQVTFCSFQKAISFVNVISTVTTTVRNCGIYFAPIQNVNHTSEKFSASNQTFDHYHGTFSATLPNNGTYFVQINLVKLLTGSYFEEDIGWLPLNYTNSAKIAKFDIFCSYSQNNPNFPFLCSIND